MKRLQTRLIHRPEAEGNADLALTPPIHMSSSYFFESVAEAEDVMEFKSSDYVYTRGNNPTLRLFEKSIADLEGGSAAVAFASGMAAISSVLLSLLTPGDRVLTHTTLYGSTHTVMTKLLPRYGITAVQTDLTLPGSIATILESDSSRSIRALFFETPANPTLSLIDISEAAETAHRYDIPVVVDNTLCSPYLQNPLLLGADVAVHSATKYICGHGDALGGAAAVRDDSYAHLLKFDYLCELGGVMSPFNAWLMLRGLKTLGLRMERHTANAAAAAEFLESSAKVKKVWYPGLPSHPQHRLVGSQMRASGGMISFELDGNLAEARLFIDRLRMIRTAVSLGDCETLIQLPAAMTHRGYSREHLAEFGLSESMIRLSVGWEHIDDIIADLAGALEGI
jgi:methionine-gamma-lyase